MVNRLKNKVRKWKAWLIVPVDELNYVQLETDFVHVMEMELIHYVSCMLLLRNWAIITK